MPQPPDRQLKVLNEANRVMTICNSCRYCEGYCATFPAMEKRLTFTPEDLHYLANLCHNCGECFYACQYAPPHEFAVNVPRVLAEVRAVSYAEFATPRAFGAAFGHGAAVNSVVRLVTLAVAIGIASVAIGWDRLIAQPQAGRFYTLIPHRVMAGIFSLAGLGVVVAFALSLRKFWRAMREPMPSAGALGAALNDVLRLTYLSSGGAGCTYPDERHSQLRRWFHHATFYGFGLCFASTCVAAFRHFVLGEEAPYAYLSTPVILGTVGGLGLLIGPAGLFALMYWQDAAVASRSQRALDAGLLALLFWTSATGLALLAMRHTPLMGFLLVFHLATVAALFLTMPYGKFVHGLYRTAALVRYAMERGRSGA